MAWIEPDHQPWRQWLYGFYCTLVLRVVATIGVRGGGSANPPGLKFSGQAQFAQIPNDKRYLNTVKNSRATLFAGQAQVAQKS